MDKEEVIKAIKHKLIISSQAAKSEPLYNENAMFALIDTIICLGKTDALRLAGERDVKYTKQKYGKEVVVIGITKPDKIPENYKELVYITPTVEDSDKIINAGAEIIAFDSTLRNKEAKKIVENIHSKGKLAMGDIGSFEDAEYACKIGCDIISTTLSGYTKETESLPDTPDFDLLQKCVNTFNLPIIMEGKIWSKEDVQKAFKLGAHSVVIGSAVTRPHKIIEMFKKGI